MFGDRNIMISWLEKVHLSWCINTEYKLSYPMNLYCISTEVFIWRGNQGGSRGLNMFIQHARPPQTPHPCMLSVAGPLHLSCRTDMGESSQGFLSPQLQLCSDVFVQCFLPHCRDFPSPHPSQLSWVLIRLGGILMKCQHDYT